MDETRDGIKYPTQKKRCPKCGSKEDETKRCPGVVHFECEAYTLDGRFVESFNEICNAVMWKRRVENSEEEVERLRELYRSHRQQFRLAGSPSGLSSAAFDAETERICKGSEGDHGQQ